MHQRFVYVLIFAFVVATGASLLLYRLMARRIEVKPGPPPLQVVLAARNLDLGTLIKDQDLKTGPWTGALPAGALIKKDDIIGRGVVATIVAGEPILESRLAPRGAGAGLASMIPAGMRAVAIRVNEVVGVGGFVVPGMRVDILISGQPPNTDGRLGNLTKTMLQNIEVLSAGQDTRRDAEGKPILVPVVNLLVTPEQAEKLSLAANQTTIQLVLRNPLDTKTAETPGAAVAQLFGNRLAQPAADARPAWRPLPAPPRPAEQPRSSAPVPVIPAQSAARRAPEPPPFVLETLQGNRRTETKFQESAQ
jgi:pilus assembly protein CpaB